MTANKRARNYIAGRAEGERWGEYDSVFDRAAIAETILGAREWIATAKSEEQRAYWLGVLRGYRAVTR